MATNLPYPTTPTVIFNGVAGSPFEFAANDHQLTVAFFEQHGFDLDAAKAVANTMLEQAKAGYKYSIASSGQISVTRGNGSPTPIFEILDTLHTVNNQLSMSVLVGAILNNNRSPTSVIGFKPPQVINAITRNILP